MSSMSVYDQLSRRILVLDGGLGTMIQRDGLAEADYRGDRFADWKVPLKGCNDLLTLTHPETVVRIHEAYLRAGADIITTDSFNANAISLSDYGLETYVYEINRQAAVLARAAADRWTAADAARPRFVAGSVGPTNRTASLSPDLYDPAARAVTFAELAATYGEQMRGLVDGGVDLILIETCFDTLNAKAALYALDELNGQRTNRIPVMVSGTLTDASGRLLSGQTLEAFYVSVRRANTLSVGLNCGLGAEQMFPFVERIARLADCAVSVHPNAGLPDGSGQYDQTPEIMASALEVYLQRGLLNIVGGCCGTTPAHIEAIAALAAQYRPREIPAPSTVTRLSGLEDLSISDTDPVVLIGSRARTDHQDFSEAICAGRYESALGSVSGQLNEGVQMLDLCLDQEGVDGEAAMKGFLNLAMSDPGVARAPWLIESDRNESNWAGLQCVQGKSLVRAFSLQSGETTCMENLRRVLRYGAIPVLRLSDERGNAETCDRAIEIAGRMYALGLEVGLRPEEIVFEVDASLQAAPGTFKPSEFLKICAWVREHCPHARILSDLEVFSAPYADQKTVRAALQTVFLCHAASAGVTFAVVDPATLTLPYSEMDDSLRTGCEELILDRGEDAFARGKAWLASYEGDGFAPLPAVSKVASRWVSAIIRDRVEDSEALSTAVCAAAGSVRATLEGPWSAMVQRLQKLYERQEFFLPQWIRSARWIQRFSSAWVGSLTAPESVRARVMLPSLAGDVQDLGKQALWPLLLVRGYGVENISGRPLAERIVNETLRSGTDVLILNGTIASAREDMIRVALTGRRKGLHVPILLNGPAVSAHWAQTVLAPLYEGPVYYASTLGELLEWLDNQTF